MNTVKIKRADLIQKLTENKALHEQEFKTAQEAYRAAATLELEKMLAEAKDGKHIRRGFSLPEPQNHTDDYDRELMMLSMSVDDVVELTNNEFNVFVMDNWSWSGMVKSTAAFYLK